MTSAAAAPSCTTTGAATRRDAPGLLLAAGGALLATLLHQLAPALGVLTWSIALGVIVANCGLLPARATPGLAVAARPLLRLGVALLGLSLSVGAIVGLGVPVLLMVAFTLITTLLATVWLGRRLRLGRPRTLLIASGVAICGASAVAAVREHAEADEDDVATAVALVTIFGSALMVLIPALQAPLGLTADQVGVWAGASVHEVAQVVAAASPAGAGAVTLAAVVKLTRVSLLAPVVVGLGIAARRHGASLGARQGPVLPWFVCAFLACVALRSLGWVPDPALAALALIQTACLALAMFALGTGVNLRRLMRSDGRPLALGLLSTAVVAGLSLAWVLWLVS